MIIKAVVCFLSFWLVAFCVIFFYQSNNNTIKFKEIHSHFLFIAVFYDEDTHISSLSF